MAKILRKSQSLTPRVGVLFGHKSILCHYYIQNGKDLSHFQVFKINKGSITHLDS